MDQTFNEITASNPADRPRAPGARIVAMLVAARRHRLPESRSLSCSAASAHHDADLGQSLVRSGPGCRHARRRRGWRHRPVRRAGWARSLIGRRDDPRVASVAALGALGGGIGVLGPVVALFVLPPASAIVAIYLARVDRLPKSIAMLHAGAALGSIVVGALWTQNASLGLGDLIVLLYPITWIAIGLALLRGLPSSESTASSLAFGR